MDTLSDVSEYLNNLEAYLDDVDSSKTRKGRIEKSEEELEMFEALEHKSVLVESRKHKIVVFTKAPPRAFSEPFMRFSMPCGVDGQGARDTKLDLAYSHKYITDEMLGKLCFARLDYGDYGRRMVKEVRFEIHGFNFFMDFVVIDYANKGEASVIFGRDILVTTKSTVDFGLGEMRIDLTMLKEDRNLDAMLASLVEEVVEVRSTSGELVKMGKASRNKRHNVNKLTPPALLKIKEIPPLSSYAPQPELEESKPIVEVLENYMVYRKKLDEIMMGRARLDNKEFGEEDKTVEISTFADTGTSVSVLPYSLYKNLWFSDPRPYHSNLTIADNTQAKAMGEVKNVRIQISYQAYLVNFLVLDILVDKEIPLLLGRPFLRTCGAIIDIGREDWLSCFEVGRDEDGNPKYGHMAPLFLDIEDKIEKALAMKAYFNPFKNIVVFKKIVNFLGSLPVQLKNTDWGNKGYGVYKKIEGDGAWHAKFKERAFSIVEDVYPEWCWEFFSTMCFERGVDRTKIMKEKYVWFRLCGVEHVLTLLEFAVLLSLYEPSELEHILFSIHFNNLEINDKGFDHNGYWKRIGDPTPTNKRKSLIKDPLMRIVHRLIVGSLVHRTGGKERCQKKELWMMSVLEEGRSINVAWIIAEYLCRKALGTKDNSGICRGHYVTMIAGLLGYYVDKELEKCSDQIDIPCLFYIIWPTKPTILTSPNVPPYPYPYVPYPYPYTHYPDMGNQSHGEGHYGASGDGYFVGSMPSLEGTSIVHSSVSEVGGSSGEMQEEDNEDDASMSYQFVHTDDDMGSKED
ncbi:hypothetical protein Tco_0333547 [Tanacetum coccineum]